MTVINVWINIDSSDIFQEGLKHTIQVKLCQGVTMAYWGGLCHRGNRIHLAHRIPGGFIGSSMSGTPLYSGTHLMPGLMGAKVTQKIINKISHPAQHYNIAS